MFKPPIEITYPQMAPKIKTDMDGLVCKAVIDIGINVDKAELLKALQYDRQQYEAGFEDGKKSAQRHAHFTDECGTCSHCGRSLSEIMDSSSFFAIGFNQNEIVACPWCGAKMDGEPDAQM